ncbi:hypothetical protein ACH42_12885 [Endozoicomonas sp. (ex Bugula neritina AB1)]|nr:hypothetical protein ACH42_12885 [Endozoicomonas sp. (ex Bugula neritina AB1)]
MEQLITTEALIGLLTLTSLEIVLGIDNIIFLTILVDRLPSHQREKARIIGLSLAMLTRIGLLLSLTWVMGLTEPLFTIYKEAISGRDIILIGGGLFLIYKSTHEIHELLNSLSPDNKSDDKTEHLSARYFLLVLIQIALVDIIFSLDSVITAVGLANELWVMVTAIVLSVLIMMLAASSIGTFVSQHPTLKVLALSFLIMIGIALVAEGLDFHIPKGYIYFAMAFSLIVEMLNFRLRKS